MPQCSMHGKSCVLYCKQCAIFICERCMDSGAHTAHGNQFCSVTQGAAIVRAGSVVCLRRLRDLRAQTAQMRVHDVRARDVAEEDVQVEKDLLWLFSAVENAIATCKQECMHKLWTHKREKEAAGGNKRAQLRNLDRSIQSLQSSLADGSCELHDLEKHLKTGRTVIERIEGAVGESRGTRSHAAECSQDELMHTFLNSARKQLTATRLCAWLRDPQQLLGIFLFQDFAYMYVPPV